MGKGEGMRKYETVDSLFTGICDAIREKDGTATPIAHQDIPEHIRNLSGGGANGITYINLAKR